jgi:hypothetical protein
MEGWKPPWGWGMGNIPSLEIMQRIQVFLNQEDLSLAPDYLIVVWSSRAWWFLPIIPAI